jgi:outer membrane protein OmpA-like peptidoglycan-associated protein
MLGLAACAGRQEPPPVAQGDPRPMVAPTAPPPSPDFNVKVAKPLVVPAPPQLAALPEVPVPPPELTGMVPLVTPEVPRLVALPPVGAAPEPPQRGQPMARPAPSPEPAPAPTAPAAVPPPVVRPAPPPAALPAAGTATVAETRLLFRPGSAELPDGAPAALDQLAGLLTVADRQRLQLRAYASGSADAPVEARKLSLARALRVRDYLAGRGVDSVRVDLRPLGLGGGTSGPEDRVDLVPVN